MALIVASAHLHHRPHLREVLVCGQACQGTPRRAARSVRQSLGWPAVGPLAPYATPDGTDPKPLCLVGPDAFVLKQVASTKALPPKHGNPQL